MLKTCMETSLRSQIALTMVPGMGPVHAKLLLNFFDIEELFEGDRALLKQCSVLPERLLDSLLTFSNWKRVEEELHFIERYNIRTLFVTDADYPRRLLTCTDAPVLLYYKGEAALNTQRIVAVVGTRGCTRQGVRFTEEIIAQLAVYSVTIVSGLAIGIDTVAHQSALHNGLPTLAVLPLGLDAIYPAINRPLAREILRSQGGLLTESMTKNKGDTYLFPRRNRIVAGCCDAALIIESGIQGGSLITAGLAADYGREVFALPGRPSDPKSQGCHRLIKQQRAMLFESGDEVAAWMGWEKSNEILRPKNVREKNTSAPTALTATEVKLLHHISSAAILTIDQLKDWTKSEPQGLAAALINLELAGLIVSLPGNRYQSA
ncbi:MAG: DNA-processing protein DprA [Sphingomonadales bacterium]